MIAPSARPHGPVVDRRASLTGAVMHRFARAGRAGAGCLLAISSAIGCSADPPAPPAPPARGTVVAEVVAHAKPRQRSVTFAKAGTHDPKAAPSLSAQSIDELPIVQDGTPGSGPEVSVELVTNSVGDTFMGDTCPGVAAGSKAFCANVTLNHFYLRPLSNVFVQVTSILDGDLQPFAAHEAWTSDPPALGLDDSLGLWSYSAPGAAPGVLGVSPDNGGSRDWVFRNPDDADTVMSLRVVSSLTYTSYTRTAQNLPFVNACEGGTNLGTPMTSVLDLPFPFTLYDTTTTKATANRRGVLLMGVNGLIAPAKSVALPASGNVPNCSLFNQCAVPRPAIFPFWDILLYLGEGALCTRAGGTAPNRTFAVTWNHLGRAGSLEDEGSDYTFTVVLHEGTDVIDLLYGQMDGQQPNASGGSASIGVQNAAGTAATAEWQAAHYGSGTSYTFTPVP